TGTETYVIFIFSSLLSRQSGGSNNPANTTQWETSTGSLLIQVAFESDSGEYWCENTNGTMSESINISVIGIKNSSIEDGDVPHFTILKCLVSPHCLWLCCCYWCSVFFTVANTKVTVF
uniref:Ig-like domain-containing protein n=1 Tax=Anabas testudineus TaxID=64144 RepID=A0A3Q1I6Y4_ANATE